jgi:hypothetical protein
MSPVSVWLLDREMSPSASAWAVPRETHSLPRKSLSYSPDGGQTAFSPVGSQRPESLLNSVK